MTVVSRRERRSAIGCECSETGSDVCVACSLHAAVARTDSLCDLLVRLANTTYEIAYVEGNGRFLADRLPGAYSCNVFGDATAASEMMAALDVAAGQESEAVTLREAWLEWLEDRMNHETWVDEGRCDDAYQQLQRERSVLSARSNSLLAKLGSGGGAWTGPASESILVGALADAGQRDKLVQALSLPWQESGATVLDAIDDTWAVHHERAIKEGHRAALHVTLTRSGLSLDTIEEFLSRYLERSIEVAGVLSRRIASETGASYRPIEHFPRLATSISSGPLPRFGIEPSVWFLAELAYDGFGVSLESVRSSAEEMVFRAEIAGSPVGYIVFDIVSTDGPQHLQRRLARLGEEGSSRAFPIGRVCIACTSGPSGPVMSFAAVQSMFHEFGHALSQVLRFPACPDDSGLGSAPIEEAELLSSWFERWVFHDSFGSQVCEPTDIPQWRTCGVIKRLEVAANNLDRSVAARMDFDMALDPRLSIRESFEKVTSAFQLESFTTLSRSTAYFGSRMSRFHPGAGFVYLWGAAYASQEFEPFIAVPPRNLLAAQDDLRVAFVGRAGTVGIPSAPDLEPHFRFFSANV